MNKNNTRETNFIRLTKFNNYLRLLKKLLKKLVIIKKMCRYSIIKKIGMKLIDVKVRN